MYKNCPLNEWQPCIENRCAWWVENVRIRPYHKEKRQSIEVTDYTYKEGAGCAVAILAQKEVQ